MVDDRDRRRGRRDERQRERPRRRPRYDDEYEDDDFDDRFDDDDEDDDEYDDREDRRPRRRRRPAAAPPRRRPARRPSRHAAPAKPGLFARLFGRGAPPPRRSGGGLDFGSLDDDYYDEDERPTRRRRPSRRSREESPRKSRRRGKPRTLLELCTPVFGYSAVLPQDEGDPQPEYLSFRQEVVAALQRLESDAKEEGIAIEDARDCGYALALFLDEQVFGSAWSAREQWAREPLGIVLNQDPEGGVNFFRRLDGLREQQQAVKEVYLLCLAMGFRGRYGTEDVRIQTKKIGEMKMRLMKEIQEVSMDSADTLFPEAYQEANAIDDEVESAPRWWLWASLGTVLVAFLLWGVLFHFAGKIVEPTSERIGALDGAELSSDSDSWEGE